MRTTINNKTFDMERALYYTQNAEIINCTFAGPQDGESVLKESRHISVSNSSFSLRYPLWHVKYFSISKTSMDEKTRAAIWYAHNGTISNSVLNGIKAVRECSKIKIDNSTIVSPEFGWKSSDVHLTNSSIKSEYLFLDSKNISLDNVHMKGKYSFQYINNLTITNSVLDTKDAFWHSKNITVRNSTINGEYLAWFSQGLTLINCKITGTQPFCYCKNLKLINCTMENCDLAFEYSNVKADIKGYIDSIKNPQKGIITIDSVGQIIHDNPVIKCTGKVVVRSKK